MKITWQFSEICWFTTLKGDYELKNVGLVEFVASHSFNVWPFYLGFFEAIFQPWGCRMFPSLFLHHFDRNHCYTCSCITTNTVFFLMPTVYGTIFSANEYTTICLSTLRVAIQKRRAIRITCQLSTTVYTSYFQPLLVNCKATTSWYFSIYRRQSVILQFITNSRAKFVKENIKYLFYNTM